MPFLSFLSELQYVIPPVPLIHWFWMGVGALLLAGLLQIHKKTSFFSFVFLWISVFYILFLIDSLVLVRYWGIKTNWHSDEINLARELQRLLHGGKERRIEMSFNFLAFVPLGVSLSGFMSLTKDFRSWHQIGITTLVALALSFCIESLQLILHVGYFELTDLLLNMLGGFVGASLAAAGCYSLARRSCSGLFRT